jgi:hypothetical protein
VAADCGCGCSKSAASGTASSTQQGHNKSLNTRALASIQLGAIDRARMQLSPHTLHLLSPFLDQPTQIKTVATCTKSGDFLPILLRRLIPALQTCCPVPP